MSDSESLSGLIPRGWARASLRDLGVWTGGGTPSKSNPSYWVGGTIPWVSPKDVKSVVLAATEDKVTDDAVRETVIRKIRADSIAFVVRSGILNRTLPITLVPFEGTVNQDIKVLTPSLRLNPTWLLYALLGEAEAIRRACQKHGTTVASIEVPKLLDYELAVPPRVEQDRIAQAVERLLSMIGGGRRGLADGACLSDRYWRSLLNSLVWGETPAAGSTEAAAREMVAALEEERRQAWVARTNGRGRYKPPVAASTAMALPRGWSLMSVDAVSALVTDGDHNPPKRHADGIPHLTAKNVVDLGLDLSDVTYVSEQDYERVRKRYEPQQNDLIITCVGTIGRVAVVPENTVFSADRNLAVIRPLPAIDQRYLMYVFASDPLQQLMGAASGSTAQPHLYLGDLRQLPVPVPPSPVQQAIVEILDRQRTSLLGLQHVLDEAENSARGLRVAVLRAAGRGRLVTQQEAAEPAAALLESIQEELRAGAKKRRPAKKRQKSVLGVSS
jgi:type I restriction enzyme, S subunit